jgi:hypothetical protein
MRTRNTIGVLLGIVAMAGALAPAPPQPEDPIKTIAEEQLKLADQALRDLDALYKKGAMRGEMPNANPGFALWERRKIDALRASGASKAEIVAALEVHTKRMKDQVRYIETAFAKNVVGRVDVFDAKYSALEAEMWLSQEKAR